MSTYQWLAVLGVPSLVASSFGFIILQFKQIKAIKLGLQAILRDRLLQAYKDYNRQGWASYDDKQNVLNIYNQYEILGKNGIMDKKHQKFLELPDEPKEKEEHA